MQLPIYQHPSLTVLIVESAALLFRLQCELGAAVTSKAFIDPLGALSWLQGQYAAAPHEPLMAASVCGDAGMHQRCSVTLDVERIFRIGFQPQRFMRPSVLVVDSGMENMNGVEFCAALADLPCKKILLTGDSDERTTLDAFNRGLIDCAIRKSDADAFDQLARAIAALQKQYFTELSENFRALLALHSFSFVCDPAVARLVGEVSAKYGIVEHYLYPQPNGLLLYDAAGRARLMVIETSHGMDTHHEVARDSGAPPALLKAIEERCVIPFFRNGDGMYSDAVGEHWYRYCEPARTCIGDQNYFWAVFDLDADELPEPAAPFARFQAAHHSVPRSSMPVSLRAASAVAAD
jgi:CheY-like chemotaxis protein